MLLRRTNASTCRPPRARSSWSGRRTASCACSPTRVRSGSGASPRPSGSTRRRSPGRCRRWSGSGSRARPRDPADRRASMLHLTEHGPRCDRDRPRPPPADARRRSWPTGREDDAASSCRLAGAVQRRRMDDWTRCGDAVPLSDRLSARRRPASAGRARGARRGTPPPGRSPRAGAAASAACDDRPVAGQQRAEQYDGLRGRRRPSPGTRQSAHSMPPADGLNAAVRALEHRSGRTPSKDGA